jgi:hypothetical protein
LLWSAARPLMPTSMTKATILDMTKVKTITKTKADTITGIKAETIITIKATMVTTALTKARAITTNIAICNAIGVITIRIVIGCGYAVSC